MPGFRGFARYGVETGDGSFEILTVKPGRVADPARRADGPAPGRVTIMARGMLNRCVTRIYFDDETQANDEDPVLARVPAERRQTLIAVPDGARRPVPLRHPPPGRRRDGLLRHLRCSTGSTPAATWPSSVGDARLAAGAARRRGGAGPGWRPLTRSRRRPRADRRRLPGRALRRRRAGPRGGPPRHARSWVSSPPCARRSPRPPASTSMPGATSQDIVDTALMLVAHRALEPLLADAERGADHAARLAADPPRHADDRPHAAPAGPADDLRAARRHLAGRHRRGVRPAHGRPGDRTGGPDGRTGGRPLAGGGGGGGRRAGPGASRSSRGARSAVARRAWRARWGRSPACWPRWRAT